MLALLLLLISNKAVFAENVPIVYFGGWSSAENYNWETNTSAPIVLPSSATANNNATFIVPSYVSGLSLICNASYPIEWNFHQEKWGPHERWMAMLTTRRTATDIYNPSTFRYSAELRFHGDANTISGNYTCQKIGQTNVATSFYLYWEGTSPPYLIFSGGDQKVYYNKIPGGVLILPCRVSLPDVENNITLLKEYIHNATSKMVPLIMNETITYNPKEGFTLTDLPDPFGRYKCVVDNESDKDFLYLNVVSGDDIFTMAFNETMVKKASFKYDKNKKQFVCCSSASSHKAPKMMHFYCDHPTTCKLRQHMLHTIETNSRRRASQNCAITKLHLTTSGVLRCLGDGIDIVREYFFPIGQGLFTRRRFWQTTKPSTSNDTKNEQPFFHWDEAIPEKMLRLTTRKQGVIYAGQNITFDCQVSPYYFSEGLKWGVSYINNTQNSFVVMSGATFQYERKRFLLSFRRNHGFLKITADVAIKSVVCIAPVWNSPEWKNTTLNLDIKAPMAPTIVNEDEEEDIHFYVNETQQLLICEAHGVPVPLVFWKKDNQTIRQSTIKAKVVNGTSTLNITRVTYDTHGTYTCYSKNVAGSTKKVFHVFVHERISTGTITVLCISLLGLICGSVAITFMIKKMKDQKNKIKHLTNVAFKDVDPQPSGQSQQPSGEISQTASNGPSNCINEITDKCDNSSNGGRYQKM